MWENAERFSLGWTEQSFFFKFSVTGQPDRSLFHCQSLLLQISNTMCCRSATRCASPSLLLQGRAESCNLLWPFQEVSSVFPLLQHQVRRSQPARSKALLWLISPDAHAFSEGQKRVSFCTIPISVVTKAWLCSQAVSGPVRSKWCLHWASVSQRESLGLEMGHTIVPLMPLA